MNRKNAVKPAEGIYYVVPLKVGVKVMSLREDETTNPAHMFYWPRVITEIAHEYGIDELDIPEEVRTAYTGIPRGRIVHDTNRDMWIILHGNDVPLNQIRHFVLQDFGLYQLDAAGKVQWKFDDHETMDPEDQKTLRSII